MRGYALLPRKRSYVPTDGSSFGDELPEAFPDMAIDLVLLLIPDSSLLLREVCR